MLNSQKFIEQESNFEAAQNYLSEYPGTFSEENVPDIPKIKKGPVNSDQARKFTLHIFLENY
jgi:hypothetical protein